MEGQVIEKVYNTHYLKNKEKIKAYSIKYHRDNKEEWNAYMRQYRAKHKEAYSKLKEMEKLINKK